jgi:hypothetical protein
MTSSPAHSAGDLESRAEELYRRYGAHPWSDLPEHTREHFRGLVTVGVDGSGAALA